MRPVTPIRRGTRRGRAGPPILLACGAALLAAAVLPGTATAAPPANDLRDAASVLKPPAAVEGTTVDSTLEEGEAPQISATDVSGTVWYRFSTSQKRRVVL